MTWPVLFPVDATGGGPQTQLNKIAFGNIAKPKATRYYGREVKMLSESL